MLANQRLKAFVPTVQPDKARAFYKDILGLTLSSEDKYALQFEANGTLLRVIIVQELKPQIFTALGWNVDDIASVIRALNEKEIYCEKYSFLLQDETGVWTSPDGSKIAWFKDPDGNILSLSEYGIS